MKITMAVLVTLFLMLAAHNSQAQESRFPAKAASCKVNTDVGSITGIGSDIHEARSHASEQCFDRRLALFEARRGGTPEGEQADLMIESCVNITCN